MPENADVLVVLDYAEGRSGRAIVLDDRLYHALGVVWTRYIVQDRVNLWRALDRPEDMPCSASSCRRNRLRS